MWNAKKQITKGPWWGSCKAIRPKSVLLIEDQEDLTRSLSMRLIKAGYSVTTALDGVTGWAELERVEPDLVLLDLNLPRLHGLKMLHRLRMTPWLGDTPVVVLTADQCPEVARRVRDFGVRRILYKPMRQRRIVQKVREVLEPGA